jgi:hypothetical protein
MTKGLFLFSREEIISESSSLWRAILRLRPFSQKRRIMERPITGFCYKMSGLEKCGVEGKGETLTL